MKKLFSKKNVAILGASALSSIALTQPALAQGFTGLLQGTWLGQLQSGADFMSFVAYLGGIAFGFKGVLNLKQWNESKGRDSTLMQGLVPIALAGVLLGLPSMLKVAKDTTTDGSLTGTSLTTGGSIRTIQ